MGILAGFMVPHPPLILPEIGKGEERKIQNTIDAYHKIGKEIGKLKPETIVLFSPHLVMYADYFHVSPGMGAKGDFRNFQAHHVKMEASYDREFVETFCKLAEERNLPAGVLGERERHLDHGTMVPLYFINQYWKEYKLVRIGLSGMPLAMHYDVGTCVSAAAETLGRATVLIASGDLSHRLKEEGPYGYQPEGPEYDRRIMDVMERGDFSELFAFSETFCEKAGECGHRSFTLMAGALDKKTVTIQRHSYEGPFGVGYGICSYHVSGEDLQRSFKTLYEEKERQRLAEKRAKEDVYVQLARRTIETYIRTGALIEVPKGLPEEMYQNQAGVFVSIKKNGMLRGCIGTIQAAMPSIAEEIILNAVSASSKDPRFLPVEPEELEQLSISVDVLGDTEKIDSPDMLDVKRYGVVVTKGRKRGLLLPNLAGVDSVADQIAIAKQKAGIGEAEQANLERFEVVRHE